MWILHDRTLGHDLIIISVAGLAVIACLYFPVPTWMLVFSAIVLVVACIGMLGNLGLFRRSDRTEIRNK